MNSLWASSQRTDCAAFISGISFAFYISLWIYIYIHIWSLSYFPRTLTDAAARCPLNLHLKTSPVCMLYTQTLTVTGRIPINTFLSLWVTLSCVRDTYEALNCVFTAVNGEMLCIVVIVLKLIQCPAYVMHHSAVSVQRGPFIIEAR